MTTIDIKLLPKQMRILKCTAPEMLISGGFGSSKTRIGCIKAFVHASVPGSLVGIFRKTRTSLMASTIRTLLEPESQLPPVIPEGLYKHDKAKSIIHIHGGGDIIYGGWDNPLRIRSMNLSAAFLDEGIECDMEEYLELIYRLRNTNALCRQIWTATNPSNQSHPLYQRFYVDKDPDKQRWHIEMRTDENTFLPKDYIQRFKSSLSDLEFRRYFKGEWCNNENGVYHIPRESVIEHEQGDNEQIFVGIDAGFSEKDPTVLLICGWDNEKLYIYEEHYLYGKLISDVKAIMEDYRDFNPILCVDPSALSYKNELGAEGYKISDRVVNKIVDGIALTKDLINNRNLIIDPRNTNLLRELDLYSYSNNGSDIPNGKNDHGPDAMRYVVSVIREMKSKIINPKIIMLGNEDDNND